MTYNTDYTFDFVSEENSVFKACAESRTCQGNIYYKK